MRSLQLVKEDKNGNHRHREKATGLFILWRKRSIPTHSEWLYPLTFDAGKGLKEA